MDNVKEKLQKLQPEEKYPCVEYASGNIYRFCREATGSFFVFGKRRRNRGWRYSSADDFLRKHHVSEKDLEAKDPTREWHKRLRRAVRCMDDSGLWPDIRIQFKNILDTKMTWEDHEALASLYWAQRSSGDRDTDCTRLLKLYPYAFYKDADGNDMIDISYIGELSKCMLKSMYFGKLLNKGEKEQIAAAISEKRDYHTGRIQAGYDVSFEYNAGKNKAWYSEEYRNCGNGHYYIALDANTALFVEND